MRDCGCRINREGEIEFCPLHEAAGGVVRSSQECRVVVWSISS